MMILTPLTSASDHSSHFNTLRIFLSLLFSRLKYLRIKLSLRILFVLNFFMTAVESENEGVENILSLENILRLKNGL
jgi:hypothetical protein